MSFAFITRAGAAGLGLLALGLARLGAEEWPLTGPLLCHDPTLVREGDTWWCSYTGAGLPLKRSADGRDWLQMPNLFTKELSWWRDYAPRMDKIDIWAPDLHRFGDRYWLYYSVSEFGKNNSAIGLMSCGSLAKGDWRDDGFVIGSHAGRDAFNAIDPFLTVDAEGKPWLAFGSWFSGINIIRLDEATMKPFGVPQLLAHRENGIEGPNVILRDGWYYLFVSIDRCCQGVDSNYKIAVGRSRSISGPYLDQKGTDMLQGGGTVIEIGGERFKGPGGQHVYQDGSRWILARHGYDAQNAGKPALRITDLFWDAQGWPTLQKPVQ